MLVTFTWTHNNSLMRYRQGPGYILFILKSKNVCSLTHPPPDTWLDRLFSLLKYLNILIRQNAPFILNLKHPWNMKEKREERLELITNNIELRVSDSDRGQSTPEFRRHIWLISWLQIFSLTWQTCLQRLEKFTISAPLVSVMGTALYYPDPDKYSKSV